ncbi:MAG: PQ-loop domain-containing transporter [Candidatus Aenigmarchaeota archaeon]|nr:PQ-loop domain-containing transporter [Candidatus Aenigmarchaeota archaeon]
MTPLEIEILGYIAGGIIAVALIPQVIKSWRTKCTKDISVAWTLFYLAGLVFFEIYAIGITSIPLMITNVIEIALTGSLLYMEFRYGR